MKMKIMSMGRHREAILKLMLNDGTVVGETYIRYAMFRSSTDPKFKVRVNTDDLHTLTLTFKENKVVTTNKPTLLPVHRKVPVKQEAAWLFINQWEKYPQLVIDLAAVEIPFETRYVKRENFIFSELRFPSFPLAEGRGYEGWLEDVVWHETADLYRCKDLVKNNAEVLSAVLADPESSDASVKEAMDAVMTARNELLATKAAIEAYSVEDFLADKSLN